MARRHCGIVEIKAAYFNLKIEFSYVLGDRIPGRLVRAPLCWHDGHSVRCRWSCGIEGLCETHTWRKIYSGLPVLRRGRRRKGFTSRVALADALPSTLHTLAPIFALLPAVSSARPEILPHGTKSCRSAADTSAIRRQPGNSAESPLVACMCW